ncbi:MAG: DoxX family protein [Bradyrhizobium sp.]|nr:DoxX family protein [Bradyrhizobium sp.]
MFDSERTSRFASYSLGALRIMSALLLMQHGMQKFFHYPPGGHHHGPLALFSITAVAAVLEFFGGGLLLLGLFTRPVAFLLAGEMAVAYFSVHAVQGLGMSGGLFPVVNQGDLAILFCFTFLNFVFAGPGAWSIDAWRARTSGAPAAASR